ncbi:MAG TPA: hypothetical protein VJ608_12830, partial [Albitalea sp.]|nr:hypothetical protein [Albitalea sp.]
MGLGKSVYEIGEKLVIVARRGLFVPVGEVLQPAAVFGLHLVELTITEEVQVKGTYQPDGVHYGYRASGSDGWMYECQAKSFDDVSYQPYQNWRRTFVEGTHYRADGKGAIAEWLIDKAHFT